MEFDQATLTPTYRFRAGIPGSSYALEMAERMHLPKSIIERSKVFKGEDAAKLENLIIDLERRSQDLHTQLEQVAAEKTELEGLIQVYQVKVKSLEKEVKATKAQALAEAKEILGKANATIERTVREIRQHSAPKEVVRTAKREIKEVLAEYSARHESLKIDEPAPVPLKEGEVVRLKSSSAVGEIISVLDENTFIVIVGNLRIKASRKELELAQEQPQMRLYSNPLHVFTEIKNEIDLRGLYGDEAVSKVDKFLDDAVLSGLTRVDIIHGKGSGALRKKIAEFLKSDGRVKAFKLGEWNEGGSGVTVVEL